MALIDRFIIEFDTALRSVVGGAHAHRPTPGSTPKPQNPTHLNL